MNDLNGDGAHPQDRRSDLLGLARRVLGDGVGIGVASIAEGATATLFPEEAAAIARAVPTRRAEFAAGRLAARAALGRAVAIPVAPDRSPVWPTGFAGSISHAAGWAVAAVSARARLVGVDMEPDVDLPPEIVQTVLRPEEQTDDLRRAQHVFCAKECAYKAQYPVSRRLFGFEVFQVTLAGDRFLATFVEDIAPFSAGDVLEGRLASAGGMILAGIVG